MKLAKLILITAIILLITSCRKEIVSLDNYSSTILDNTIMSTIPHLQSNKEIELIEKHGIKSMSFIKQKTDSTKLDSLTYVEFDRKGRIVRRTTKENTSIGCFPNIYRQEFIYEDQRLKKVNIFTFKYKSNSVLKNWLETDTSRLLLFDWEDYTYDGDTTIVESGYATWKYIKDESDNIIQQLVFVKTNNQQTSFKYIPTSIGLTKEFYDTIYDETRLTDYTIEKNMIISNYSDGSNEFITENLFDERGLLIKKNYITNNKLTTKIKVSYSYY